MSVEQFLKDELMKISVSCQTQDDVFEVLFKEAFKNGYVNEMFLTKVKEREAVFPTGLSIHNINVAIPHTDPEYVKKQFIAVATLENPVKFRMMDDNTKEIDVSVVLLLGLNQPHSQIEVLQELIKFIQNETNLQQILSASNCKDIRAIFNQHEVA